jgi:uncharacterized membrane protein
MTGSSTALANGRPSSERANLSKMPRVTSIDVLRGAVMIVMTLDHVRDFFHQGAMVALPTDLITTTPLLFMTRWSTHFCAPTFALTAGLGAWFRLSRGDSRTQLARFLVTRGLWLMVLELVVMRFGYYFSFDSNNPILLLVLWSLGLSMIVLSILIWLPSWTVCGLAAFAILLHPLLNNISAVQFGAAAGLWNVIHQIGSFRIGGLNLVTPYPLIPWCAIVALGYSLGPIFQLSSKARQRCLLVAGGGAIGMFLVMRSINFYGDPVPWTHQRSAIFTVLSFLNMSKYPASPDFLLMTLGVALIVLGLLEGASETPPRLRRVFEVFGHVPLFYYVLHFYIAHLLATALAVIEYGGRAFDFVFLAYPSMGGSPARFPPDFGHSLWLTYLAWISTVAICYPLCKWYAEFKANHHYWWLGYV